jgi:RND superfamily putative drug exporter
MELLGDRNWWIPKWIDRILPNIDVEGPHEVVVEESEPERQPEPVGGQ